QRCGGYGRERECAATKVLWLHSHPPFSLADVCLDLAPTAANSAWFKNSLQNEDLSRRTEASSSEREPAQLLRVENQVDLDNSALRDGEADHGGGTTR